MPIKIHHGPPGSYKTSGALGDDFLREARAGRVIVTNVRGLTYARVLDEFPDLPKSFDVISLGDSAEDFRKLATWFHWVPKGAFLFIDEAQLVWPRSWRDADIRALDYPGGMDKALSDRRPVNWEMAWDKHRHWNWDFVLTTPQYKKIRDDVKGVADGAYKHKDLALIGWTGRYIEGFHLADDSGDSQSHFMSVNRKKVPSYVFKLYDSTTTGQHSHTKSGASILKNPKIILLLVVLFGALAVAFSNGRPAALGGESSSSVRQKAVGGVPAHGSPDLSRGLAAAGSVDAVVIDRGGVRQVVAGASSIDYGTVIVKDGQVVADVPLPFGEGRPEIVAYMAKRGREVYTFRVGERYISSEQFSAAGYRVEVIGDCMARLVYGGRVQFAGCSDMSGGAERGVRPSSRGADAVVIAQAPQYVPSSAAPPGQSWPGWGGPEKSLSQPKK